MMVNKTLERVTAARSRTLFFMGLHVALRRPERMKINREETKNAKISSVLLSCSSFLRG
jgi:hypothetical protein